MFELCEERDGDGKAEWTGYSGREKLRRNSQVGEVWETLLDIFIVLQGNNSY